MQFLKVENSFIKNAKFNSKISNLNNSIFNNKSEKSSQNLITINNNKNIILKAKSINDSISNNISQKSSKNIMDKDRNKNLLIKINEINKKIKKYNSLKQQLLSELDLLALKTSAKEEISKMDNITNQNRFLYKKSVSVRNIKSNKSNNVLAKKSLFCNKNDDANLSRNEFIFNKDNNNDNNNYNKDNNKDNKNNINKISNNIKSAKNIESTAVKKEENNEPKKDENKNDMNGSNNVNLIKIRSEVTNDNNEKKEGKNINKLKKFFCCL
jgi:hypothetical protein